MSYTPPLSFESVLTKGLSIPPPLASDDAFQTFFDAISDSIIVGSPDAKILYTNSVASLKLGYSSAEFEKMHILDIYPVDKRQEAEEIYIAMFKGECAICSLPLQHKDGSLIPVETRTWSGKWKDADCIFGLFRDLSREQEALQKFERLFHSNPIPMAISIFPGNEFADVNNAWLSTLGYSREEVLGKTSRELSLFQQPEKQSELLGLLIAHGRIDNVELKVKRKDGTILDGLFSGELIDSQGKNCFLTTMTDQTEHKLAETKLQESEERLALAIEGTSAGLWDWDMVNDQVVYSSQWRRMLGYDDHEVENAFSGWRNLWHPDDCATIEKTIQDCLEGKTNQYEIVHRLRHKDGGWRWIFSRWIMLRDSTGKPFRFVGTNFDVTELRTAQDALEQVSERLSLAVRAGSVGIWDLDIANDVLVWDDMMFRLYGIKADAFSGAYDAWKKGLHPDDLQRGDAEIQMALRGEKEYNTEFRVVWPDGTIHFIRALALVRRDASGKPVHLIGTNWDITETKHLEETLRDTSAYNRTLLEVSIDALATVDRTGRVTDVNVAAEKITGFPRQDIIGSDYSVYFADPEKAQEGFRLAFANGTIRDYPLRVLHRDGHSNEVLANASIFRDRRGQISGVFVVMHDITERILAEQASLESATLKIKDEVAQRGLELLNKTVSDIISTLSKIVETRDPFTAGHQVRVAQLATSLAKKINLPDEQVGHIQIAATLHDIGKIYIPSDILNKPGKLLPLEYQMVQLHVERSYEILKSIEFSGPIAQIAYQHHERIDNSGYPRGLKNSEILLEAKILAVADVVEAMSSHRPYRPALGIEKALEEISNGKGKLYDPDIVDACLELFNNDGFEFEPV